MKTRPIVIIPALLVSATLSLNVDAASQPTDHVTNKPSARQQQAPMSPANPGNQVTPMTASERAYVQANTKIHKPVGENGLVKFIFQLPRGYTVHFVRMAATNDQ